MNYWWIRIFDYSKEDETAFYNDPRPDTEYSTLSFEKYKGTLLDEYYLCGDDMTRDKAKQEVKQRSNISAFCKPRKTERAVYAIIIESDKFFYERYMTDVDTVCFNCHKHIKGKMKDFPHNMIKDERVYFCSYECKYKTETMLNPYIEGEWQCRESAKGVFGYIYHVYNRSNNKHYIGQSVYAPFFRWQEHFKDNIKGDITDLEFNVITEVRVQSKKYLNDIEAWWINKYIEDYGEENVMNITKPRITEEELLEKYYNMIKGVTK